MNGPPIFLFTDFGSADIYVGQVKAVLHAEAPGCAVIDLLHDAPPYDIASGAHLLSALARRLPPDAMTIAVVDPGVGGSRNAVALRADGRWYVGPDNGLLSVLAARSQRARCYRVDWMMEPASASFHGRDVFAPAAAHIARGVVDMRRRGSEPGLAVAFGAADLARVIYIDHYGNAMTGVRAQAVDRNQVIEVRGRRMAYARVFSEVAERELFWYENSIGLVEIAANQASAAALLGLEVGNVVGF